MFLNGRERVLEYQGETMIFISKSTPLFVEILLFQVAEVGFPRTLDVLISIQCSCHHTRTVPDFEAFSAFSVKKILEG